MELAVCYNTWSDWDLLKASVNNISPVVDRVIIVYSKISNYGEVDKTQVTETGKWPDNVQFVSFEPKAAIQSMENETLKRNYGLSIARAEGYTHYLCMDSDEFYDQEEFKEAIQALGKTESIAGLVCKSRVYFSKPDLTIGLDTTLVPFVHKITPTLKHDFNRRYPFAWEGRNIRIDPTRSFNINEGVEACPIIMEHASWVRKDLESYKRKIRNSTARPVLDRSNILQDLVNAKEGYFCQFYQKPLVRVPNRFNIPYGELSNEDLQSLAPANT